MLKKEVIQTLLNEALETGADFAELFFEDTNQEVIRVTSKDVSNVSYNNVHGVGVRLIKNNDVVYGYSNEVSEDKVRALVVSLRASFDGKKKEAVPLNESLPFDNKVKRPMEAVSAKEKTDKLLALSEVILSHDPKIVQSITQLLSWKQSILVANSNGTYQDDERHYARVILMGVASENGQMQQVFEGPGRAMGFEIFDDIDTFALAKDVAERAVHMLSAQPIVAQEMPVVLANGWGGVIFHEACGHPLEATAVAKGLSPFTGKLGQAIGSSVVTAYDDGDVDGAWGRTSFDDEGM